MSSTGTIGGRTPPRHRRYRWTLPKFEQLIEHEILGEEDRIELIDGELYAMAAKGIRHENVRGSLLNWLIRNIAPDVMLFAEPGWRPDGKTYVEPDFLLTPPGEMSSDADPQSALLVIEIARSSLAYDTGLKARLYARLGVREYWVIDARTLSTRVHRQPDDSMYTSVSTLEPDDAVEASLIPGLSLQLGSLGMS